MTSKKSATIAKSKIKDQKKAPMKGVGYKGHVPGSRKGTIHELFDKEGSEIAWTRGLKIGLKESTLRSWFGVWQREGEKKSKAA